MKSAWRIGSVFGIPLLIDSSWFLILAFVTFIYGSAWQGQSWGSTAAWVAGFAMALLLFASVLLHELGHSLVARSQGINVTSITLFLFGGIASIDQESKTPSQAFQVAIAGPAVSFILFILLTLVSQFLSLSAPAEAVLNNLAGINLVLALFNMIPGLPLDGGQVLKAAIWKLTGSRLQGVRWAAKFGQMLGWMAIVIGVTLYVSSSFTRLGMLWIALLGWFGVRNASAYSRVTDLQEALVHLNANAALSRDFRVVDADMTLRQFADKYLLEESPSGLYFAASDGRYRGMVTIDDLRQVERSLWETQTLHDIVHPLSQIPTVLETTPLTEVIDQLEVQSLSRITVLSPAGAVAGTIDRGDVVRALAEKLNIPISDTVIKRIKEEGTYPPGLQLHAIAKATNESAS
jgi:Zn-dependent protease/CBS domain-containing protein